MTETGEYALNDNGWRKKTKENRTILTDKNIQLTVTLSAWLNPQYTDAQTCNNDLLYTTLYQKSDPTFFWYWNLFLHLLTNTDVVMLAQIFVNFDTVFFIFKCKFNRMKFICWIRNLFAFFWMRQLFYSLVLINLIKWYITYSFHNLTTLQNILHSFSDIHSKSKTHQSRQLFSKY